MSQQLAYVIITPYSLHKSRTGGILSRLITRTGLELAATRMFAPSEELVKQYSQAIISQNDPQDPRVRELIHNYILQNLSPDPKGQRTLELIEPENFRFPSGRPGNVIDFFSRTGLFIVGIKLHRMSVAQALEFYGPVRDVLRTKLKDMVAGKAKTILEKEFG